MSTRPTRQRGLRIERPRRGGRASTLDCLRLDRSQSAGSILTSPNLDLLIRARVKEDGGLCIISRSEPGVASSGTLKTLMTAHQCSARTGIQSFQVGSNSTGAGSETSRICSNGAQLILTSCSRLARTELSSSRWLPCTRPRRGITPVYAALLAGGQGSPKEKRHSVNQSFSSSPLPFVSCVFSPRDVVLQKRARQVDGKLGR